MLQIQGANLDFSGSAIASSPLVNSPSSRSNKFFIPNVLRGQKQSQSPMSPSATIKQKNIVTITETLASPIATQKDSTVSPSQTIKLPREPQTESLSPNHTVKAAKSNKILDMFTRNTIFMRREQLNNRLSLLNDDQERKQIKEEWMMEEAVHHKKMREKTSIKDFDIIQTLGHGGFGVVRLVREKHTGDIFAMKTLRKQDMLKRKQEAHVKAERDLLCQASMIADWIVRLICTFQDENYLYFVLEYMPGGDLLGLLIKLDIFPENFAMHYAAEMVLAIEEVHKLG
jgi:Protein kinase domain